MSPVEAPLLNHGVYDVAEVARLLRTRPEKVLKWSTRRKSGKAVVPPSLEAFFSFHDLISLMVVIEASRRGVPDDEIRRGARHLALALKTPHPLAHESLSLATVGRSLFADLDQWVDAGKGGQLAFLSVIRPLLRPIEYGPDGLAAVWRPLRRIWLNPRVQAGAPCIDNTRVPTYMVASLLAQGEDSVDITDDYGLELEDVTAAADFEAGIRDDALTVQ